MNLAHYKLAGPVEKIVDKWRLLGATGWFCFEDRPEGRQSPYPTGWSILLEREDTQDTVRKSVECSDALHSAFYPLTLPLTVGPGTISVAITLGASSTRRYGFHVVIILAALLAMAAVAIAVLLC